MHPGLKKISRIKLKQFYVYAFLCLSLIGCKGYNYVSINIEKSGEFSERISHFSEKVTDISISGYLNNKDTQTLIELATNSDLLSRMDLSNGFVELPHHAFAGCIYLKEVSLPLNSMTSIPDHLFSGCTSLSNISIPENYKSIEEDAFSNCTALKKVVLPSSLESIGDNAFRGCTNIEEVRCSAPVPPTCKSYCFDEMGKNCILIVPKGSASLYKNAIGWEKFKTIEESKNVNKDSSWDNL